MSGSFEFYSPDWDQISPQAKDFVQKLICVDPQQRLTASQALLHPWILNQEPLLEKTNLASIVGENLVKNFNAKRKLKGGMNAIKFAGALLKGTAAVNSFAKYPVDGEILSPSS